MRKEILYTVLYSLLFLLPFTSCKKHDTSTRDELVGEWQQQGYPDNTINFNNDGTGKEFDPSYGSVTFTWSLENNNSEIVFNNGGFTWDIETLNSSTLTFEDMSSGNIYSFVR
jgi:hypothetical protein